jgi:hypothetical protein
MSLPLGSSSVRRSSASVKIDQYFLATIQVMPKAPSAIFLPKN